MKITFVTTLAIMLMSMYASTVFAGGLFLTCGGGCTVVNVEGKDGDICLKFTKGCCIMNKEIDSGLSFTPQIGLNHKVFVDAGEFALCGVGDFYGTANGTKIRDEDTGIQYIFDSKLQKFNEVVSRKQSGPVRKEEILRAQQGLKTAGYSPGSIDGIMGSKTREALRSYQAAHGLSVTGELDEPTRKALGIR